MNGIQFAINPLQWLATKDGWLDFTAAPPLRQLLEEIAAAGFSAISIQPPKDGDVREYAAALKAAGVAPAPGYLSGPLEDPEAREQLVAAATRLARAHVELGLKEMFVAAGMAPDAPRVSRPACGVNQDDARLAHIAATLERIAEATSRLGVTACLHQHVGTWIEVEPEVEWLLARLDHEVLALGPDTGHLAWAGIDPKQFIARHASQVRALHVKDLRLSVASAFKGRDGARYRDVVAAGLWVEPGRGDLDLRAVFGVLPADFTGWAIIEVDMPDLPSPQASARACAEWARQVATW
jgi:inosose dehydratase